MLCRWRNWFWKWIKSGIWPWINGLAHTLERNDRHTENHCSSIQEHKQTRYILQVSDRIFQYIFYISLEIYELSSGNFFYSYRNRFCPQRKFLFMNNMFYPSGIFMCVATAVSHTQSYTLSNYSEESFLAAIDEVKVTLCPMWNLNLVEHEFYSIPNSPIRLAVSPCNCLGCADILTWTNTTWAVLQLLPWVDRALSRNTKDRSSTKCRICSSFAMQAHFQLH